MNHIRYFIFLLLIIGCSKSNDPKVSVPTGNTNPDTSQPITPNDFLANSKYDKLVVEIQYVNGFQPTASTISNLINFLQQRLNKSSGVTIIQNAISSPGKSSYGINDLINVENSKRTVVTSGTSLTAYIFFADAEFSGNSGSSKVLGVAYGNTSIAIFEKTIKDFSGGIGQPSVTTLESTVSFHELGHLLGLVNNGSAMQAPHQDSVNGKHCDVQNCLMYFNVETSDVVANILGGSIPSLDAKCLADLKGNGGL